METKKMYMQPQQKVAELESESLIAESWDDRSARLRFNPNDEEEDDGYAD